MDSEHLTSGVNAATALQLKLLIVDDGARIGHDVTFVVREDDGSTAGVIRLGRGAIVRSGTVVCSGVVVGDESVVGHNCVLRRGATIGFGSVISHMVSIERNVRIGRNVRVSALTHLTGDCVVEDDVQIGARVATVNDAAMEWGANPPLNPPRFRRGCRVGSGCTILAGIEVGENALIGAGSVVTRNVPSNVVAYGVPAYIQREREIPRIGDLND